MIAFNIPEGTNNNYKTMFSNTYNGYAIDFNIYGQNEYSVQYCGDDLLFQTETEAKAFIDSIQED